MSPLALWRNSTSYGFPVLAQQQIDKVLCLIVSLLSSKAKGQITVFCDGYPIVHYFHRVGAVYGIVLFTQIRGDGFGGILSIQFICTAWV